MKAVELGDELIAHPVAARFGARCLAAKFIGDEHRLPVRDRWR
jgi:hypothetical protein